MTPSANLPEDQQPQATHLSQVGVESVNANQAVLSQSLALDVQCERVTANGAALALVHANEVDMQNSGAVAVRAEKMFINGYAGAVVAGSVEFGHSSAGVVAANEVRGENIRSFILLSQKVEGNVTTTLDTRGALIAGLAGGLFAGIVLLLGRMLFGRK